MSDPRGTTLEILQELFAQYPGDDFEVLLWDGTRWPDDGREAC